MMKVSKQKLELFWVNSLFCKQEKQILVLTSHTCRWWMLEDLWQFGWKSIWFSSCNISVRYIMLLRINDAGIYRTWLRSRTLKVWTGLQKCCAVALCYSTIFNLIQDLLVSMLRYDNKLGKVLTELINLLFVTKLNLRCDKNS
jgi:hypothetical protein